MMRIRLEEAEQRLKQKAWEDVKFFDKKEDEDLAVPLGKRDSDRH